MSKKFILVLFVIIIFAGLVTCLVPSVISIYASDLNEEEESRLNDAYEQEPIEDELKHNPNKEVPTQPIEPDKQPTPEPPPVKPEPPKPTPPKKNTSEKVEKSNWFNTVNSLFPKWTNATVIDVLTGKQYNVKRIGGYNHADVETLTKNDTAIFKSIYGNIWQWTRRAVWVKVNDTYIAASINGKPHSYQYNYENNEDGHTCIHFYMSRTHCSNKVDPEHKRCVQYAYDNRKKIDKYM